MQISVGFWVMSLGDVRKLVGLGGGVLHRFRLSVSIKDVVSMTKEDYG